MRWQLEAICTRRNTAGQTLDTLLVKIQMCMHFYLSQFHAKIAIVLTECLETLSLLYLKIDDILMYTGFTIYLTSL